MAPCIQKICFFCCAYVQIVISLCSTHVLLMFNSCFPYVQLVLLWNKTFQLETKCFEVETLETQNDEVFQAGLLMTGDPFQLLPFAMSWSFKRSTGPKKSWSQMLSMALRPTLEKAFQCVFCVLKRLFQRWSLDGFLLVWWQNHVIL